MLKAELNGRFCGSSEDRKAHRNSDSKDCALRIQVGTRLLLGIELKTILVTFWNRTCLHLVHALRLCGRLNLQVTDQARQSALRLWHGYCWLFVVRLGSKKQSRKV
jgi:hypothetical protein